MEAWQPLPTSRADCERIRERGGKVVVVDPRRTKSAAMADRWIPIRPGTDSAFLLALAQVLFDEGRVGLGEVSDLVEGLDRAAAVVAPFTPEQVAAIHRNRSGDNQSGRPGNRRSRQCGCLWPDRNPHSVIRHDCLVGGGSCQHHHGKPRSPRWCDVSPSRSSSSSPEGSAFPHRTMAQPGAGFAGGAR